jgi:integrase
LRCAALISAREPGVLKLFEHRKSSAEDAVWIDMTCAIFKLIRALEVNGLVDTGLTFHGLRHTLGKLVMEAGGSKEDIGLILGDRSLAMATFYSREFEKMTRTDAMVRRLESVDIRKAIGLAGALPFSLSQ